MFRVEYIIDGGCLWNILLTGVVYLLSQCVNEVIHLSINWLLKLFLFNNLFIVFWCILKYERGIGNINYCIKRNDVSLEICFTCKLSTDFTSTLRQLEPRSLGVEITFLPHKNLWLIRTFSFLSLKSPFLHIV